MLLRIEEAAAVSFESLYVVARRGVNLREYSFAVFPHIYCRKHEQNILQVSTTKYKDVSTASSK